jgi:hypothetical protein
MTKTLSLRKDWDFVSKDTEISVGKFELHHFTPLTLGERTGIVSDEETVEIWTESQKETINKVRDNKQRTARTESPVLDEKELERSFCLNRPEATHSHTNGLELLSDRPGIESGNCPIGCGSDRRWKKIIHRVG